MSPVIDYYCALISPFTYLGGPGLAAIAKRTGATIIYKPFSIGEVFKASGGLPLGQRPKQRQDYRLTELTRISRRNNLPLNLHPAFFPADDTMAARMVIAAQLAGQDPGGLAQAILRACWAEDRNIADPATLQAIATAEGFDAAALMAAANSSQTATIRANNTQEAIERGVFGAPTYVFNGELFWGQDRLEYLEDAINAAA